MKGRVSPFVGRSPILTAILKRVCIAIKRNIPNTVYPWKSLSFSNDSKDIRIKPQNNNTNKKIKVKPPNRPNSSTKIANIKSVWASGK